MENRQVTSRHDVRVDGDTGQQSTLPRNEFSIREITPILKMSNAKLARKAKIDKSTNVPRQLPLLLLEIRLQQQQQQQQLQK